MQAYSAIFTPNQAKFVVLPSSPDIRSAQEHDHPLQNWIIHHCSSATRFKPDLIECEYGTSLWADVSATPARVLVPTSLQRTVFDSLHCIAHSGLNNGLMLIKRSYWWQCISKDVTRWTQSCAACQLVVRRPTIGDASNFGRKLASSMAAQTFHENPRQEKRRGRSYAPLDLWTATCVLVRADKVQSSLVPKYTGPFRVPRSWKKCFSLQLENREDTVSVDRLRPFYEHETDHREPVTDVVDTGKSNIIDDHVDDLVFRRSNRTVSPPIRLGDTV